MAQRDTQSAAYRAMIESLVARREAANITQWELARRTGTDQSQISKFERCERRLDIFDYVRYCRAIGLEPSELLKSVPD